MSAQTIKHMERGTPFRDGAGNVILPNRPKPINYNNAPYLNDRKVDPIYRFTDDDSVTMSNRAEEEEEEENEVPVITSNGGGATASINVAENTTAVTTVIATDADGDTITYGIEGGTGTGNEDSALFAINTTSGVLTFASAPDYETQLDHDTDGVYNVIVKAQDPSAAEDTQTLSVTVTDVAEATTNFGTIVISGTAIGTAA